LEHLEPGDHASSLVVKRDHPGRLRLEPALREARVESIGVVTDSSDVVHAVSR